MSRKSKNEPCCASELNEDCCRIESLITVDERGQMVLPKDLRDRAKICAGDKFAVINWQEEGDVSCLILIKADLLADRVKEFLRPLMRSISAEQ